MTKSQRKPSDLMEKPNECFFWPASNTIVSTKICMWKINALDSHQICYKEHIVPYLMAVGLA